MVEPITEDVLSRLQNAAFRSNAEIYIGIEADFRDAIASYGLEFAEASPNIAEGGLAERVAALEARGARVENDAFGNTVVPYADALDLPWGARVSPGAKPFLVEAGADVSYQKAANLLARNGSRVSATTVMNSIRQAGALCAKEGEPERVEVKAHGDAGGRAHLHRQVQKRRLLRPDQDRGHPEEGPGPRGRDLQQ